MKTTVGRSGNVTPLDLLALKRLINGSPPCVPGPCGVAGWTMLSPQP